MSIVSLDRIPAIAKGVDALEGLGPQVLALTAPGSSVLLVVDQGLGPTGFVEAASRSLTAAGLGVTLYDDVKSDPSMAQVDAAAEIARRENARAVVSIGGGSVMDAGKSVAAIAGAGAPAAHYGLSANPFPAARLASVCVPSTSGTGAETTRTAVLSDVGHAKIWLWGDALKPDLVILDPRLTASLPPHLTAATGIDALVHAIEAATNANANDANNVFCHEAIRLVVRWLPRAMEAPGDLDARAGLQWAATLAGIGIDNAGTAIAHNIGHALASLRPVHHGRAVGLAMMATLPWNVAGDDGLFAAVAAAMGESGGADGVPAAFSRLLRAVGVNTALNGEGYDVTVEALAAQMAKPENAAMRRSNRRPVADDDLALFARAVLLELN
jgi:alcohol dehydrogenase class IV